jgi:hypothetical protein
VGDALLNYGPDEYIATSRETAEADAYAYTVRLIDP